MSEEETTVPEAVAEVVPPAAAPAPAGPKRPPPPRAAVQTLAEPPREMEANFLLEEILADGVPVDTLTAHVTRIEPPPGIQMGAFSCSACPSADEFYRYLATYFHQKSPSNQPAKYQIQFRTVGGKFKRTGYLRLPSPSEIVLMGPPGAYGAAGAMNAGPYGQGMGGYPPQPPMQPQQHHPAPPPGPPQYRHELTLGALAPPPQPAAPQGTDPAVAQLRAELGYMAGLVTQQMQQTREIVEALRSGRVPSVVQPAAPAPAPAPAAPQTLGAPPPVTVASVAAEVLRALGITQTTPAQVQAATGLGVAPGVAAAPAALVPSPPASVAAKTGLQELQTMVTTMKALKGLGRELQGLFEPELAEDGEPPGGGLLPIVEEPDAGEKLPFNVIPITGITLGGHPVAYARDRETGKMSLEGIAFSNPILFEKGFGLLETLTKAAVKAAGADETKVPHVERTHEMPQLEPQEPPPAYANGGANGAGSGWPSL